MWQFNTIGNSQKPQEVDGNFLKLFEYCGDKKKLIRKLKITIIIIMLLLVTPTITTPPNVMHQLKIVLRRSGITDHDYLNLFLLTISGATILQPRANDIQSAIKFLYLPPPLDFIVSNSSTTAESSFLTLSLFTGNGTSLGYKLQFPRIKFNSQRKGFYL